MSTFEEKLTNAESLIAAKKIPQHKAIPSIYRLLWRIGVKVPPPHFATLWQNICLEGVPFGVIWGFFIWLILWRNDERYAWAIVLAPAVAGFLFGTIMASRYRSEARTHAFPRWKDL
ncbi:DUF6404 family protein [Inquilinus limosus]|uniref:DUF6404 family protein n=1 Tax=Inquilinus limosus TaxID=171674 RepID=UPI003F5CF5E9